LGALYGRPQPSHVAQNSSRGTGRRSRNRRHHGDQHHRGQTSHRRTSRMCRYQVCSLRSDPTSCSVLPMRGPTSQVGSLDLFIGSSGAAKPALELPPVHHTPAYVRSLYCCTRNYITVRHAEVLTSCRNINTNMACQYLTKYHTIQHSVADVQVS
jgi:hypothetical protein